MNTLNNYTIHAERRAQQRCIPPGIDEWLDRYGKEEYDGRGYLLLYFDKNSVRVMEHELGRRFVHRSMVGYWDVYKVKSCMDNQTVTLGYRTKRFRKRLKKQEMQRRRRRTMTTQSSW